MAYNVTADQWYQYFEAPAPQVWILVLAYGARFLWSSLCIFCNYAVVRVTYACKSLQGICNLLIAMECAFFLVSCFSYWIPFGVVLSGLRFMPYSQCGFFLFPLDIFGNLCEMTMVFTGFDRLLSVVFPFWYKDRQHKHVLPFVWIGQALYAAYWIVIYVIDYEGSKEIMVSCSPTDLGQGPMGPVMSANGMTLSAMLMVTYTLLWLLVFVFKTNSKHVKADNRKLIKSLIIIILLNMVGVFLKNLVQLFLGQFPVDVFTKGYIAIGFNFLNMSVYSANGPILFVQSDMYRRELQKQFKWLPKGPKTKVTVVQLVQPHHQQSNVATSSRAQNPTNTISRGAVTR